MRLAQRLNTSLRWRSEPLESWMEDLYRRAATARPWEVVDELR